PVRCRPPRVRRAPTPTRPSTARAKLTPQVMRAPAPTRSAKPRCCTGWSERRRPSIGLFGIDRIDRAGPLAVKFIQQLLRRRGGAREAILQHVEEVSLVSAADVEALAAGQAGARQFENVGRDREQGAAADHGGETLFRHGVAELLTLFSGPRLDQIPGGIEADIVI